MKFTLTVTTTNREEIVSDTIDGTQDEFNGFLEVIKDLKNMNYLSIPRTNGIGVKSQRLFNPRHIVSVDIQVEK